MLPHLAATLAGALAHLVSQLVAHGSSVAHAAPFLFATAPAVTGAGAGGDTDEDDGDDGARGEETPSIAEVGREILAGLTDEEKQRQLSDDDDEPGAPDADLDDEEGEDADEAEGEDSDEADDADDDGEDADEDEDDAPDDKKSAKDKGKGGEKPEAETDDADTPKAIKVVLPGQSARGEDDLEIEIDDKDVADRIRRLKNDGLRLREYTERRDALEAREAEASAVDEALESDPVSFILDKMTPERQLAVARALLVEHMDDLLPDIDKYVDNPTVRADARVQLMKDMKKSAERLTQTRDVRVYAQKCMRAVESLVPAGTQDDVLAEFVADARRILFDASNRGDKVTPETVPALLARRVKLYGFDKKPKSRKPSAPAKPAAKPPEKPRAKPISDRAREIAGRKPGAKPGASATESRIRRTQAARAAGSRVAPAGAGAAPVQVTALPPEAEQSVEAMSKHLRKTGLPDSWKARDE